MAKIETGQFLDFVKLFSIRRNKKQKKKIQDNLVYYFNSFGLKQTEYVESLGLRKVRHFVFGDIDKAELVFACGYDTAERIILGNGDYWPLDENRNRAKNFVNITIQLVISVFFAVAGIIIIRYAFSLKTLMKIVNIVCALVMFYIVNIFAQGLTNHSTFSKSCPIYMCLELAKKCNSNKVAYVFLDYGSYSKVGINFLNKEQFSNKKIIYLDFFGDGDTLLIGHDNNSSRIAKYIDQNYKGKCVKANIKDTVNRFDSLNNVVTLSNIFVDKFDKSFIVKNVKTDDDLIVDSGVLENAINVLLSLCKEEGI